MGHSPGITRSSPEGHSPSAHRAAQPRLHSLPTAYCLVLTAFCLLLSVVSTFDATAQRRTKSGSHTRATRETLSNEDRAVVEQAISVVCSERQQDPRGSVPIDDMQKRPSLSLRAPEVISGVARAQRL